MTDAQWLELRHALPWIAFAAFIIAVMALLLWDYPNNTRWPR